MQKENSVKVPELLTTTEAATFLRRSTQTLRCWAMRDSGPIRPVRTRPGAPLLWRRSDIEAFIQTGAAAEKGGNAPRRRDSVGAA